MEGKISIAKGGHEPGDEPARPADLVARTLPTQGIFSTQAPATVPSIRPSAPASPVLLGLIAARADRDLVIQGRESRIRG